MAAPLNNRVAACFEINNTSHANQIASIAPGRESHGGDGSSRLAAIKSCTRFIMIGGSTRIHVVLNYGCFKRVLRIPRKFAQRSRATFQYCARIHMDFLSAGPAFFGQIVTGRAILSRPSSIVVAQLYLVLAFEGIFSFSEGDELRYSSAAGSSGGSGQRKVIAPATVHAVLLAHNRIGVLPVCRTPNHVSQPITQRSPSCRAPVYVHTRSALLRLLPAEIGSSTSAGNRC